MTSLSPSCFGPYIAMGAAESPWDDLQGPIAEGTGGAALTYEVYRDTSWKLAHWRYDQADELHLTYQFPHSWVRDSLAHSHIHLIPMVSPATPQVFAVTGQYVWAQHGAVVPASASWTAFSSTLTIGTSDGFTPRVIPLATITPPAGSLESDLLLLFVKRDLAHDTYNTAKATGTSFANVGLLSIDVHIRKQKLGTDVEYPGAQ